MKKLLQQAVKFVGLSGVGWGVDFCTYAVLGRFFSNLFVVNYFSSWVGVTIVFIFSTRIVFRSSSKNPLWLKYVLYIVYQIVLILLISQLLSWINTFLVKYIAWNIVKKFSYLIAKILVTPVTMTLNFFVMKGIIEKI